MTTNDSPKPTESVDSSIGSPSIPLSTPPTLQKVISQYKCYEDAFVKKVKDELMIIQEHPAAAGGIAVASGLVLMRARILKTGVGLKELGQSVEKLKKESKNTILRAGFGEEELLRGGTKLRDAGNEIRRTSKSIYKIDSQAADLMDGLRVIPGRNALKLRAEVASLVSDLKQQRQELDKRIIKISELGIRV